MDGKKKVPVRPHVRKGDVAVTAHERVVAGKDPSGLTSDEVQDLRDGLSGLSHDPHDIPEGWKLVADVLIPCAYAVYPHGGDYDLSGISFAGRDLSGADFDELYLAGVDFTGADLTGASFRTCNLDGTIFAGANLTRADLKYCEGEGTIFDGALLDGVKLSYSTFRETSAAGLRFGGTPELLNAIFGVRDVTPMPGLENAEFSSTSLSGVDWSGVDLTGNKLQGIWALVNSSLDGANLSDENLTIGTFTDVTMHGINAEGTNFSGGAMHNIHAHNANFSGAKFTDCYFLDSTFTGSDFRKARADSAAIETSSFDECDFAKAAFTYCSAERCSFRNANFTDSDLTRTDFSATSGNDASRADPDEDGIIRVTASDLSGAVWSGALLSETRFTRLFETSLDADGTAFAERVMCRLASTYDQYAPQQYCEEFDVETAELGVLLWGGMLEARDNLTGEIVTGNFDLDNLHVPQWAIDNW